MSRNPQVVMLNIGVFAEKSRVVIFLSLLKPMPQTTVKAKYVLRIDSEKYCEGNNHGPYVRASVGVAVEPSDKS